MTEAIRTLIDDNADIMLAGLQDIGFTQDQASRFLAETRSEALNVFTERTSKFELNTASEISLRSLLVDKIDASAITARSAIEPALASNGLQTILPYIVGMLVNHLDMTELVAAMTTQRGLMHRVKGMLGHVAGS